MEANTPSYLFPFNNSVDLYALPESFDLMQRDEPHQLCLLAARELQAHLAQQREWKHNFGLSKDVGSQVVGKMFGVLVVKTSTNELGYLAAFSGKLGGTNSYREFVPPVFDLLTEGSFLNLGMQELSRMNERIKLLSTKFPFPSDEIDLAKEARRKHSVSLQQEIFEQYRLINEAGEEKSLTDIFRNAGYKNPPAGAGECAGIKLLQYAFSHKMKPIALAEFWWGQSPKSATWKHGQFYPCCREKCEPILMHMLS